MARRNDHSREELREMALSAAETLLDDEGSAALSTRRIAAAIGYSAGSLYQVFENHDDLRWQLNRRTLQMLLAEQSAVAVTGTLVLNYARQYLAFASRWPQRWSLLFEHSLSSEPNVAVTPLFERLEEALHQQMPGQDAEAVQAAAQTLWAGVHGIAVLRAHGKLFQHETFSADQMAQALINRYLAGWQQELTR